MKNFITFYNLAMKSIENSAHSTNKVTWAKIKTEVDKNSSSKVMYKLSCMKYENPADGEEKLIEFYNTLNKEIHKTFSNFT